MALGPEFWLPMSFILVGVGLFLWELTMPGFFVAVPATVAIILGIIGFVWEGFLTNPRLVLLVGIAVAAPVTFGTLRVYHKMAPPDAPPTTTTSESMEGRTGKVAVATDEDTTRGKVRLGSTTWSARSDVGQGPIAVGTVVEVVRVSGVHVVVRPAPAEVKEAAAPPAADPSSGAP